MQKKCCVCKTEKDLNEFAVKKATTDGRAYDCKECHRKYCKSHYIKNKNYYIIRNRRRKKINAARIKRIKKDSDGCVICHESAICCLDFHHLYDKKFVIAAHIDRSWLSIKKEIAKCIILCSNCHRKVHAKLITLPDSLTAKTSVSETEIESSTLSLALKDLK